MGRGTTRLFAILMPWGRVGSNLVTSSLMASADIEIDNEPTTRLKTFGLRKGLSSATIAAQQLEHLSSFRAANRDAGAAVGLKLSYRSLIAPHYYMERLAGLGFRPIIILRHNFLRCAVSQLRAVARAEAQDKGQRIWRSPWAVAVDEPKPGPTHIDTGEAIRLTHEFEKYHWALLDSAATHFGDAAVHIEYRELAADPEATIRKLVALIGLPSPGRVCVPEQKATSDSLSDDITNYAEFAQAIQAAGFGRFLEAEL